MTTYSVTQLDHVYTAEVLAGAGHYSVTQLDNVYTAEVLAGAGQYHVSTANTLAIQHTTLPAFKLLLSSTITTTSTLTYKWLAGAIMSEIAHIRGSVAAQMVYHVTQSDIIRFTSVLKRIIPVALNQGLTVGQTLAVAIGHTIHERASIAGTLQGVAEFHLLLAQSMRVADMFRHLVGASFSDTAHLTDTLVTRFHAVVSMIEWARISGDVAGYLLMRVTCKEGLGFDDAQIAQMLYIGGLSDTVDLTITMLLPGDVTTWAINTRTNAVSEYQNWKFNSFAQMGNRYLAAADDGLYELDGARDGVESIIADIRGGMMQMNGPKLSGLKGVYLGIHGQGEMYLKLVSGDRREYVYKTSIQPGDMTTKINIGKGLRTRYLMWELISTGQSFDIDTIEFVPMMSARRV